MEPLGQWPVPTKRMDPHATTPLDSQKNSSAAQNSGSDTGSALCEALDDAQAKQKKKHSGPRKRRPKKKADDAGNTAAGNGSSGGSREPSMSPLRDTVAARSSTSGHNTEVVPVARLVVAAQADDIEALLKKELSLDLDGDDRALPQHASPSRPVYQRAAYISPVPGAEGNGGSSGGGHHRPHPQKQQQPQRVQQGGLEYTDNVPFALPTRSADTGSRRPYAQAYNHHHQQQQHHHQRTPPPNVHYYQQQSPPLPQPFQSSSPLPLPAVLPSDFIVSDQHDRSYWTEWVIEAAEKERARRLNVLKQLQQEEEEEIQRRRKWAIEAIEREQEAMMREMFLDNMKNTQWFQSTISRLAEDYEVVCPNSWFGCMFSCMLKDLEIHLESCVYRQVPDTLDQAGEDSLGVDFYSYDVVCPNAVLGCNEICSRENLAAHLTSCPVNGISREKEWEERLEGRRNVLLATEEERARRMSEQQMQSSSDEGGDGEEHRFTFGHLQRLYEEQTAMMQVVLHDEIVDFCEQQELEALQLRPWINQAVAKVKAVIQELWGPKTQIEGYGSFATQLHSGYSDVDLVVFGVAEEENLTCQQCVSALAAHFAVSQSNDFVEISAITRASVPLLKAVVLVNVTPETLPSADSGGGGEKVLRIPFDITFDDPRGFSHNGIASASLISTLSDHFYGLRELAFVLKYFLVKRGLNDPYVGGLSSYGLLLMIIYILQEQGALVSAVAAAHGEDQATNASRDSLSRSLEATNHGEPNRVSNARYEIQRQKGEQVAQEIINQSLARQQLKQENSDSAGGGITACATKRKTRRPHLPSLLVDDDESEHEAKPFLLGKYLMDFLQFYGNDFRQHVDRIIVSGLDAFEIESIAAASPGSGSGRSPLVSPPQSSMLLSSPPLSRISPTPSPPPSISCPPSLSTFPSPSMSPLASSPLSQEGLLMIRDPLQPENNVGKSCYRVSQVCRDLSDFLSFLTALIVRGSVMTTGKKKKKVSQQQEVSSSAQIDSDRANKSDDKATGGNDEPPVSRPPRQVRKASHRILTSVFEMKTRDTRASLDLTN